jgi:hypothetical protein
MTHPSTDPAPIACTLTPGALRERTGWIADLNRTYLRAHRRDGGVLELAYARAALPQVRELVRREAECCAFLRFDVAEEGDLIGLRVAVPSEALEHASALLAPFLAGTDGGGSGSSPKRTLMGAAAVVACGACCALPFALPAVALTSLGSVSAVAADVAGWARYPAIGLIAAGWLLVAWRSRRTGRRPATSTIRGMVLATLVGGVAALC